MTLASDAFMVLYSFMAPGVAPDAAIAVRLAELPIAFPGFKLSQKNASSGPLKGGFEAFLREKMGRSRKNIYGIYKIGKNTETISERNESVSWQSLRPVNGCSSNC